MWSEYFIYVYFTGTFRRVDIIVRETLWGTRVLKHRLYIEDECCWWLMINDWSGTSCLVLFVFKTTNDEWEWIWHSTATAWFMIDFHSYTGMSNSFYTYSSLCSSVGRIGESPVSDSAKKFNYTFNLSDILI